MNEFKASPKLAESLIRFAAGPHLKDEISGDLQERLNNENHSNWWYWAQTFKSAPALLQMNLKNVSSTEWIRKTLFVSLALILIWLWEVNFAQRFSWPVAKTVLHLSPLTPAQTCKMFYILFYGLAIALLFSGLSIWQNLRQGEQHFKHVNSLLVALIASIPVAYYCVNPGPYDGALNFRAYQVGLVWSLLVLVLAMPKLIYQRRRPATLVA